MRDSPWLGTVFARVEERTTVRPDFTYTAAYVYEDRVVTGLISRTVDGQPVPWFHLAYPDRVFTDLFFAWNMEFVTPPGATNPPTRQDSLRTRYLPERLGSNVLAVSYALGRADSEICAICSRPLAWHVTRVDADRFVALSPVDGGVRRAVVVEPARGACTGITRWRWP